MEKEEIGLSKDLIKEKLEQLKKIMPEVFTEGKVDYEKFKLSLGEDINFEQERYHLSWAGKSDCFRVIQEPSTDTLVPCKEESVNWDTTENIFIEGENLEVLKILQKSYYGKIKMIYIDPPYNTGNDSFIYPDKFSETRDEYERRAGEKDEEGYITREGYFRKNSKESGKYHSNWLSMMYPRLFLARNLLKEDGVIFVSIGEEEYSTLKSIMNEIFGEENFRNTFTTRRYDKNINRQFIENGLSTFNIGYEYIIAYSKTNNFKFNPIYKMSTEERQNFGYWKGFWNDANRPTMRYDVLGFTPESGQWKWSKEKAIMAVENYSEYQKRFASKETLEEYWVRTGKKLQFIRRNINGQGKNKGVEHWIAPSNGTLRNTNWTDLFASKTESKLNLPFDFPKNIDVLQLLINSSTDEDDIILDFFAGSSSSAHAMLELNKQDNGNRKFIMIQLPEKTDEESEAYKAGYETIAEIGKERIRRVLKNTEKEKKEKPEYFEDKDLDLGLKIFKHVPSNFKEWRFSQANNEKAMEKQLDAFISSEKEDTVKENMLFELIIKSGCKLSDKIEEVNLNETKYYKVEVDTKEGNKNKLIFAIDTYTDGMTKSILEEKPKKVICLDSAFSNDDQLKTNTLLQMKDNNIDFLTF